ncbi:MAG TPA: hypothetical protein VN325_04415 [Steroidobacteraceae bacterium]|nr:hypothetical protein [Steroidobacteraceae bacterium]
MQDNLPVDAALDEPVVDGAYIENDLGISSRTRRTYGKDGILPPPDANLLGRNIWKQSTYRKFKADLLAGKFALLRRPPHLQGEGSLDEPLAGRKVEVV